MCFLGDIRNVARTVACSAFSILVLTLGSTASYAGCTTCIVVNNVAYCTGGSVAELCQTVGGGCSFSGSRACGGSGGCFLPDTTILTQGGPLSISAVRVGTQVLSMDSFGEQRWVTVQRTYRALRVGYFRINEELCVTEDHPFNIDGEWLNARELKLGDILVDSGGQSVEVTSIDWIDDGVRVFNIDVLSPDTFYAGGYLVHNKDPIPQG